MTRTLYRHDQQHIYEAEKPWREKAAEAGRLAAQGRLSEVRAGDAVAALVEEAKRAGYRYDTRGLWTRLNWSFLDAKREEELAIERRARAKE